MYLSMNEYLHLNVDKNRNYTLNPLDVLKTINFIKFSFKMWFLWNVGNPTK